MISARQLEYFRAVARELNFTRAAASLHIAQPALSQQIRKLERQLGLALFERDNHRVEITPAGTALLDHATRILTDLESVEEEMLGWSTGTRGRIRLGAAQGLAVQLAQLLARFCRAYPAVDVELREETTEEMLADLYAGRLDAATVAALPAPADARLASHPFAHEPLVLVTATESPLAGEGRVAVADLDGIDLVLYGPGSAVREMIVSALAAAGATPRVRFETREYRTARVMASLGMAVAVLPRSVAEEPGPAVRVLRLEPEPVWTPALAWGTSRTPSPALAAFLDLVIHGTSDDQSDNVLDV
jgi:DNA-binding transcriptional LysR family regulator